MFNFAINPAKGGVPAIENIITVNVKANKGFETPKPFNSLIKKGFLFLLSFRKFNDSINDQTQILVIR
tara:strand:+ start:1673 stop:1876 length:204 start_codon:yes stop_codon:yes gene_type:complete